MSSKKLPKTLPPFVKYESICEIDEFKLGNKLPRGDLRVFEKVDGGNCQVRCDEWQLLPGSRSSYLKGSRVDNREWFQRFTRWIYSNASLYALPSHLVVFGEWSGNHTLTYSEEYTDKFFLTDMFDIETRRFKDYEQAVDLLKNLGVEQILSLPVLARGRNLSFEDLNALLEQPSDFREGPREGLVIKNYGSNPQLFLKTYHPDFAESRRLKDGTMDYLTSMRFRKAILRLVDENQGLQLQGLSSDSVLAEVASDVLRESGVSYSHDVIARRWGAVLKTGKLNDLTRYLS